MKKVILGLVVFAVVYLAIALGLSIRASGQNAAFRAQLDRLDELGTRTAAALEVAPAQTLAQACKALPEVKRTAVKAYFPKSSVDVADLKWIPQRAIQDSDVVEWPWRTRETEYFMFELMSDFPPYWPMYLEYATEPFGDDLADTKYLVVHLLTGVTRPRVLDEKAYEAGQLTFNSAVVDATTGKVLCAGSAVVTETREVHVTGHGKTDLDAKEDAARKTEEELLTDLGFAARHFALGEVCWIGGEYLCTTTYKKFERPQ